MAKLKLLRNSKSFLSIVVVAAGSSERMGFDKTFANLAGRTVIEHSLSTFQKCNIVNELVVVVKTEDLPRASDICKKYDKVKKVVCGGAKRLDSVLAGVTETEQSASLIGVHDGARPLVSEQEIVRTAELALKYRAAIPALQVSDTIKKADSDGRVTGTPMRSELYAVQTPQVFDSDILKGALAKAVLENAEVTDDSMAVERLGLPVYLSEGSAENIKLTRPIDFIIAEVILERNENRTRI